MTLILMPELNGSIWISSHSIEWTAIVIGRENNVKHLQPKIKPLQTGENILTL